MNFRLLKLDLLIVVPVLFLTSIGLVILFSIDVNSVSPQVAFEATHQLIAAIIGLLVMVAVASTDYHIWKRPAWWFYIAGIIFLVAVPLIGASAGGATRWIDIGSFRFQPSEIVKIAVILLLAKLFSRRFEYSDKWWVMLLSLGYVLLPVGLIFLQPDLGTAVIFGFVWFVMLLSTKFSKLWIALFVILLAGSVPLVVPQLAEYQQERIATFLNPSSDPQGSGYNVIQSTIAVGSGQFLGRGLDAGSQSQLNFLPSQHTDFIFAVISEKLGFIGSSLVILAYAVLLIRSLYIGLNAQDIFGYFLAIGIVAQLFFQTFINIGMNMGIMPVTGLTLPLVSFGGTSIVVTLFSVGLLLSISRNTEKLSFR